MIDSLSTRPDHELGPGIPIATQSSVKTFRMCPREFMYKYHESLAPKSPNIYLHRGKWVHACLEEYYSGGDWKVPHARYTKQFSQLMDEEKDKLGDLPREIELLLVSYFWHYGDPAFADMDWEVLEVEKLVEAVMPNGHVFRGKVDMIIRNAFGIWIVDHKTHGRFPNWEYRLLDEQSTMYVWAARQMGIPVEGFIWNYISTKHLPKYNVLKSEKAFYAKSIDAETTYPALVRAVKAAKAKYGEVFLSEDKDKAKIKERLAEVKADRWKGPDVLPTSPFFRRDILEKTDDLIERTLKSFMRTSDKMHNYDFSDPDCVERDVKSCEGMMCSFKDLSMSDLVMGESENLKRKNYKKLDPLAYQSDNAELETT